MEDNRGNSFDNQGQNQFSSDNAGNYSPSASFNYTNGKSNSQGGSGINRGRTQQHPKRRSDRYKRETINQSDKLVKQNDMIIKLLKEIRDRLPEPPKSAKKTKPQRKQSIYRFDDDDAKLLDAVTEENDTEIEAEEVSENSAESNEENQTALDLDIAEDTEEEDDEKE